MPSFRNALTPKLSKNVKNAKFQDAASPKLSKNAQNAKFQDATSTGGPGARTKVCLRGEWGVRTEKEERGRGGGNLQELGNLANFGS